MDGMDVKLAEPITAAHLISAAKNGNSKANAVLDKGWSTDADTITYAEFWFKLQTVKNEKPILTKKK